MRVNNLDAQLESAISSYKNEIKTIFEDESKVPATHGDLNELARQTFYTLDTMRESIIQYLKSQER